MNEDIKYNKRLRKKFLNCNLLLIKKWTEEVTQRAAIYGLSDEFSIAIMTFNSAIDRYNGKGDFYDFARSQVRQRLYECMQHKAEKKSAYRKNFLKNI